MKAKNTLPLVIGVALGIGLAASASVWSRGPVSGYQGHGIYQGHGMMGGYGPQATFSCAGDQQHFADARYHHHTVDPHVGDRKGPTGKQGDRTKKGSRTTR